MQRTSLLLLALALAAASTQAQEKYQRKSGLWELKRSSTVTSGQVRIYQMCVDHASDNALSPLAEGAPGEVCNVAKVQRDGDKLAIDAACKMPQSSVVATTHAVVSGTFDSAYRVESKTKFEPAVRGHSESSAVLEAKWTGPCKPGQKPRDVIDPRGGTFNLDAQQTAENTRAAHAKKEQGDKAKKKRGYVPMEPGSLPMPLPGTTTK